MNYLSRLLIAACALCLCCPAQELHSFFPESHVALLRSEIQTRKTDLIQQNLTLSDDQARKFWPLQRSYENDLSKLDDSGLDFIRAYAKNWDDLNDEMARSLGKRVLNYHKKRDDLHGKYFDRISKEISPTVAAKFFQIELELEDLVDLRVASSMPLIK
ncbi:MAG: hypothetical protein JO108_01645 [Acidobacteriaceae bacterium]|nr:hypothetical protein [Acidobacteriaceae bacterium]